MKHNLIAVYAAVMTIIIVLTFVYKMGVRQGEANMRVEMTRVIDEHQSDATTGRAYDALVKLVDE